jgi:hypothetical protein
MVTGLPIFRPLPVLMKLNIESPLLDYNNNNGIDNLKTQKKYISMKNSQFFNYLLYVKLK